MAATGVGVAGGVVLEANALGALLTGSMSRLVCGTAVIMSARSATILESTATKINGLPNYNSGNFRRNLYKNLGNPPSSMGAADAHHVFPQKFKDLFDSKLEYGGIHNPKYGSWWNREDHQNKAYDYNKDWELFFMEENGVFTVESLYNKARELARKYGFELQF